MVKHQSIQIRGEAIFMQLCDKYFSQQKNNVKYQWIVGYTLRRNHVIAVIVDYVLEDKTKLIWLNSTGDFL